MVAKEYKEKVDAKLEELTHIVPISQDMINISTIGCIHKTHEGITTWNICFEQFNKFKDKNIRKLPILESLLWRVKCKP